MEKLAQSFPGGSKNRRITDGMCHKTTHSFSHLNVPTRTEVNLTTKGLWMKNIQSCRLEMGAGVASSISLTFPKMFAHTSHWTLRCSWQMRELSHLLTCGGVGERPRRWGVLSTSLSRRWIAYAVAIYHSLLPSKAQASHTNQVQYPAQTCGCLNRQLKLTAMRKGWPKYKTTGVVDLISVVAFLLP